MRMSKSTLKITCCRIAAERVVSCALKQRKESAGTLLKSTCSVNSYDFPSDGFGKGCHTAASEPYFYDTAYKAVKHVGVIPVDNRGRCYIAKEVVDDKDQLKLNDKESLPKFKKWLCTIECKVPTDQDVCSILETKKFV